MNPHIDGTKFGSITVDGETYGHDIVIRLSGKVKKRKKRLSKQQYGTSHTVAQAEAEHIYDDHAEQVIVGTGQHGLLKLSDKARASSRIMAARSKSSRHRMRSKSGTRLKARLSPCSM
jgi:hypothetical protein